MDDRRDRLDQWLHAHIDPLPPPPGTFELVKRRARRRRLGRLAASAAAAAAVIAAVATIPTMGSSLLRITQNQGSGVAAQHSTSRNAGAGRGTPTGSGHHAGASNPGNTGGRTGGASAPPVPADFAPTSVTFVRPTTGWVIGQAGAPGQSCASRYCTSVARTDNAGQTWYGVPAPGAGAPDGSSGVSQIRFLNTSDGWAFGPELWATHDGGQQWTQVATNRMRVIDLETVGTRAFALLADCGGTGPDFAAQCTSVQLWTATASSDTWAPVGGPVTALTDGGQDTSAALVLTASRGYLLAPDGTLYAGPTDGGPWQQVAGGSTGPAAPSPGPSTSAAGGSTGAGTGSPSGGGTRTGMPGGGTCVPGQAQPDGQPSGALLAAANASDLVLVCADGSAGGQVFASSDGGQTWQQRGVAPGGTATSVAAEPNGTVTLATTDGLDVSQDGGATWQQVEQAVPGGFGYVGMTTTTQGVAVPADTAQHAVWFTFDAGRTWRRSAITGP